MEVGREVRGLSQGGTAPSQRGETDQSPNVGALPRHATRISKTASLFHFVHNMSEWHCSCRKRYNRAWIPETGKLSESEREALAAFASRRRQRGPRPHHPRSVGS